MIVSPEHDGIFLSLSLDRSCSFSGLYVCCLTRTSASTTVENRKQQEQNPEQTQSLVRRLFFFPLCFIKCHLTYVKHYHVKVKCDFFS